MDPRTRMSARTFCYICRTCSRKCVCDPDGFLRTEEPPVIDPDMWNITTSALLSLLGVGLIWPNVFTESVSLKLITSDSSSVSQAEGEERPRVTKRSFESCDSTFDHYCLNNGKCMLLLDMNEHHCKCGTEFSGPRCEHLNFVVQPLAEGQIIFIVFCVILLMIGLSGALYLFCKWYKKSKFSQQQKQPSYKVVQAV